MQLTIHIQAMIQGGVFDRFPGAQIIVGHLGENLVYPRKHSTLIVANAYLESGSTCKELGKDEQGSYAEDV